MTTSPMTDRALAGAGLGDFLATRRAGADLTPFREKLANADILVLGALADRIRQDEVGDVVRISVLRGAPEGDLGAVQVAEHAASDRGLAFVRAVALARILGAPGASVRVDWTTCGQELAQVALSFGANELVGAIVSRRGLPIAEDRTKKVKGEGLVPLATLKTKELIELVRRSGRKPVLIGEREPAPAEAEDATEVMA